MGQSMGTIVIGGSLSRAASLIQQRSRGDVLALPHLMTLAQVDKFISYLHQLAGRDVPDWITRQRGQLQDAMIDCHLWLQGRHIALAGESDVLSAWCDFAVSQGMVPGPVIAATNQPGLATLPVDQVKIGDLEDMALMLEASPVDLLVCNSHGAGLANHMKIPLIRAGFPIYDQTGTFRRMRQGYAGIRDTLFELANLMQERHHHTPVWRSPLKQQFAGPADKEQVHASC
jgi:nitrogenase molybdenum-iron protein NifN